MSVRLLDVNVIISLSCPKVPPPGMTAQSLAAIWPPFPDSHRFWNDDVSLADSTRFDLHTLTTFGQITDAYLAGLAFCKGARLATLDRGVPWRAVRGANANLIERIVG
jgi:hypothetical protein